MKIEYHPKSGRAARGVRSTDYRRYEFERNHCVRDDYPWHPFRTRVDFEAAELALRTSLNKAETETLFDLLRRTASNDAIFTLRTYNDVVKMWDLASSKRTGVSVNRYINMPFFLICNKFTKTPVTAPYEGEDFKFDVYYRPLWDWALDLLNDEHLAPYFEWDAQRLYKFDGISYKRVFGEPWTGDQWWNIQV
jgi:hypothetical protein